MPMTVKDVASKLTALVGNDEATLEQLEELLAEEAATRLLSDPAKGPGWTEFVSTLRRKLEEAEVPTAPPPTDIPDAPPEVAPPAAPAATATTTPPSADEEAEAELDVELEEEVTAQDAVAPDAEGFEPSWGWGGKNIDEMSDSELLTFRSEMRAFALDIFENEEAAFEAVDVLMARATERHWTLDIDGCLGFIRNRADYQTAYVALVDALRTKGVYMQDKSKILKAVGALTKGQKLLLVVDDVRSGRYGATSEKDGNETIESRVGSDRAREIRDSVDPRGGKTRRKRGKNGK